MAGPLNVVLGFTLIMAGLAFKPAPPKDEVEEFCQWEVFNATCASDHVVLMHWARYGRMTLGRCIMSDTALGCSADVLHALDKRCSGRQSCMVGIPDAPLHQMTSCAADLMGYLEASYSCVPVVLPRDKSCTGPVQVAQREGYLASSITDAYAFGGRNCPWQLTVEPGQKINITLLDFSLKPHSASTLPSNLDHDIGYCNVYAIVSESGHERETAVCGGTKRQEVVYLSETNTVEVKLTALSSPDNQINFLLQFEPVGCPDPFVPQDAWYSRDGDKAVIKCNFTSQTWHLVCKGNGWFGDVNNCTDEYAWNSQRRAKLGLWPPYGLLAAVIIGVILGVFLGLCLLGLVLICKRRRDARKRTRTAESQGALCATYDPNDGREEAKIVRSCGESGYSHVWELRSKEMAPGETGEPSMTKLAPYHNRAQQIRSATLGRNHDHIYESPKLDQRMCLRRSADHAHTLPFLHEMDCKGKRMRRPGPPEGAMPCDLGGHAEEAAAEDDAHKVNLRFSKGLGYRPVPVSTCMEPTDPRRGCSAGLHSPNIQVHLAK